MSHALLLNFMRVAHDVTKAERAFAVDTALTVVGTLEITPESIEAPYLKTIQNAINQNKYIITDNLTMSIDPSKAPITNQSFPKLRFVVVVPLAGYGAVCLDQSLRGGVTSKEKVERLERLAQQAIDNPQLAEDEDALMTAYDSL